MNINRMNMKKKILALAIAGSLAVPQVALAAEDDFGMQYTSASEGFYASIRAAIYANSAKKDGGANVDGSFSRFGIAGTNDLGGGLEGFYTYEAGVAINNGGDLKTRLGYVGLRGAFGEIVAGSIWHNAYNWTDAATNIATVYSGYNLVSGGRKSKVIQYTSPDLNGFQVSILGQFDSSRDGEGAIADATAAVAAVPSSDPATIPAVEAVAATPGNPKDDNDLDEWSVAAKYDIQGFSLGAAYYGRPDALEKNSAGSRDDWNAWVLKAGYGQDNWSFGGWFSKDNASDDYENDDDEEKFGLGGTVTVDKIGLYGFYENVEYGSEDDSTAGVGINYNLGAKTKVFIEYFSQDLDSETTEEDDVLIGLRHDF